ncbi:hypothetical protein NKG05_04080 [Oerskovia sp. M15]
MIQVEHAEAFVAAAARAARGRPADQPERREVSRGLEPVALATLAIARASSAPSSSTWITPRTGSSSARPSRWA